MLPTENTLAQAEWACRELPEPSRVRVSKTKLQAKCAEIFFDRARSTLAVQAAIASNAAPTSE